MKNTINIVKYSGAIEAFDLEKLKNSLRRANAKEPLILEITDEVQSTLID